MHLSSRCLNLKIAWTFLLALQNSNPSRSQAVNHCNLKSNISIVMDMNIHICKNGALTMFLWWLKHLWLFTGKIWQVFSSYSRLKKRCQTLLWVWHYTTYVSWLRYDVNDTLVFSCLIEVMLGEDVKGQVKDTIVNFFLKTFVELDLVLLSSGKSHVLYFNLTLFK